METKESCRVLLDKGATQKVKCYKFMHKPFNRELAVHEHLDYKNVTSISDVKTGLHLCKVSKSIKQVTMDDVLESLGTFTKHFTLEEILKEFERRDLPCS